MLVVFQEIKYPLVISFRMQAINASCGSNPNNNVLDLEALAEIARANEIPLVIDSREF